VTQCLFAQRGVVGQEALVFCGCGVFCR